MTTITPDMLKQIADTLGTTPDILFSVIYPRFGVTIDDTPADETEQTMAMTITQEQFEAACRTFMDASEEWMPSMKIALESLGITITPAEPPAEMVKLAREIVATCRHPADIGEGCWSPEWVALATLQHAVDVVERAPQRLDVSGSYIDRYAILTALGAGGHDAG